MLDVKATDGRARLATWEPTPGRSAQAPGLVWPENSLATRPDWVRAVVTLRPGSTPAGLVELVSKGTWFHPTSDHAGLGSSSSSASGPGPLVVPAVAPAPTTQVQVIEVGDELAVFHDAAGWASNPKNIVPALAEAVRRATPGRLLWAPGLGTPADYALWAYLGVDLFDASPLLLAATRGTALTTDGPMTAAEASAIHGGTFDLARLVGFNLESARTELERVRAAIADGNLRALVERRIYSDVKSIETLRRFDREHRHLEAGAPRHRAVALPAMTQESLWSPEVESFRRRLRSGYQPPRSAKVLVLMPCSQRKPYKTSRSHRAFGRVLDDSGLRPILHEVMVTSPLGLVPRDVEEVYPAQAYDIPVTGHWTRDEEAIVKEQLASLLDAHQYDHVIVHMGQATFDVLRHLLPPDTTRHTCLHHPTSQEDLARLGAELARLKPILGPVDAWALGRARKLEDLHALATFQFGRAVADELVAGAEAHGRMPYVKLERAGTQLATTTPDRGVLSLTLDGARILARHATKRVFIQDFPIRKTSSLFAVGVVGADPDVRAGDEVVVVCGDDVRACGVAAMSGEAMTNLRRGVAVTLRHLATTVTARPEPAAPEVPA